MRLEHPEILFNLSPMLVFLAGLLLSFMFVGLYFAFPLFLHLPESYSISVTHPLDCYTGLPGEFGGSDLLRLFFSFSGRIAWLMNGASSSTDSKTGYS